MKHLLLMLALMTPASVSAIPIEDQLFPDCEGWHPPLVHPLICQIRYEREQERLGNCITDVNPEPPSRLVGGPREQVEVFMD